VKTKMSRTKRDFLCCSALAAAVGNEKGFTDEQQDQPVGAANHISISLKLVT